MPRSVVALAFATVLSLAAWGLPALWVQLTSPPGPTEARPHPVRARPSFEPSWAPRPVGVWLDVAPYVMLAFAVSLAGAAFVHRRALIRR
jgi:hypothetical protein